MCVGPDASGAYPRCPDGYGEVDLSCGPNGGNCCMPAPPAGCRCNADCADREVCHLDFTSDGTVRGECGPPCEIACFAYDPVCGADGQTYACGGMDASCHGVPVLHAGECAPVCRSDADCPAGTLCTRTADCPLPDDCGGCASFCRR